MTGKEEGNLKTLKFLYGPCTVNREEWKSEESEREQRKENALRRRKNLICLHFCLLRSHFNCTLSSARTKRHWVSPYILLLAAECSKNKTKPVSSSQKQSLGGLLIRVRPGSAGRRRPAHLKFYRHIWMRIQMRRPAHPDYLILTDKKASRHFSLWVGFEPTSPECASVALPTKLPKASNHES
jgi:hypothetical protein